jgi:site-specific recombinase XerD
MLKRSELRVQNEPYERSSDVQVMRAELPEEVPDPETRSYAARLGWIVAMVGEDSKLSPNFHPLAARWKNVALRELELGIPPSAPVLVSGAQVDGRINVYFRQAFSRDRMSTAQTYAAELRMWLGFLDRFDVRWDEAQREDVRSFQSWRVYDPRNARRVTAATWNKGWAALRHFYEWARQEGWIEQNPVGNADKLKDPYAVGGHKEKNARASRDRWLTPAEYDMWREVGMRGYAAEVTRLGKVCASLPSEAFRGRNTSRNAAFTDYARSSGLRLAEIGLLLDMEIPAAVGEGAPLLGKGRVFRHYEVMHRSGLESVHAYRDGERRESIERAQRSGRYNRIRNPLLVAQVLTGRHGQQVRLQDGRIAAVVMMSMNERRRLFLPGANGVEPACLWLTETGDPMPPTSWDAVFRTANERVSRAREALGVRSPWVHVSPHSLRFTFALTVLVAGVRATDERLGLVPADAFLAGNYSHVFEHVRDLLGHASVETTRRIYLEPVKSLRRSGLFSGATVAEVWENLSTASPLIGFGGGE